MRLSQKLILFVNAGPSRAPHSSLATQLYVGLSYILGASTTATGTYQRADGGQPGSRGNTYSAQLAQSPPLGPGFGYFLGAEAAMKSQSEQVQLIDHGNHGFYQFDLQHSGQQNSYLFTFSGSIVVLGGRIFAGPPIEGAFALIRTGLPNVEGYLYHQSLGKTDSKGDLLVSRLVSPYYGNTFSINDQDIPVDYRIDATDMVVAPPYKGGAVVAFPIRPVRSFVGKLRVRLEGKDIIPVYGTLTMVAGGKSYASPVGEDGSFFLDSPPTGRHPVKIDFAKGTCSFTIDIQDVHQPFAKLGTLRCTM